VTSLAGRLRLAVAVAAAAGLWLPAGAGAATAPTAVGAPGRVVVTVDDGAVHDDVDAGGASSALALPDDSALLFGPGAARSNRLYFAKLGPSGSLDGSFGAGGVASLPAPGGLLQVLAAPGGKVLLVTASQSGSGPYALQVTRVNADATLDRGYGAAGTATTALGEGCGSCTTAAVQPDGAVVLTGTTGTIAPPPAALDLHWALTRLTPAGAVDPGFGAGGIATIPTAVSASGFNVAIGRGGAIVTEAQTQASLLGPISSGLLLARLTAGGAPDPTFAGGGTVDVPFATGFLMLVQDDGAIVVNGQTASGSPVPTATLRSQLLARYTVTGARDATFGAGGIADLGAAVDPSQLLRAGPTSALVVGAPAYALAPGQGPTPGRLIVRLLTGDGAVDPALGGPAGRTLDLRFGGGGSSVLVSVHPRPVGSLLQNGFSGSRVVVRADGSYLVPGGVAVTQPTGEGEGRSIGRFAAAALTPAFTPDTTFGGAVAPLRVSVRLVRQRATTARRRHGIRIVLRASASGLARVKITRGGRAIAHSLLPVFTTAATELPVELTRYGDAYLRRHHRARLSIAVTARDLLTATTRTAAVGRLR
jgi:uncharacterized delta-60 repeat protein